MAIDKYKAGKITKDELKATMCAYFGWLKHCDSKHLLQKVETLTGIHYSNWDGKIAGIKRFYGKRIKLYETAKYSKYYELHFIYGHISYTCKSTNKSVYDFLTRVVSLDEYPITFKLTKY